MYKLKCNVISVFKGHIGCLSDSRGKERRAVHQGAVVVVADEVVLRGGLLTRLWFVGDLDVHGVAGVVEVDDVDVKHQYSGRRDDASWTDHN